MMNAIYDNYENRKYVDSREDDDSVPPPAPVKPTSGHGPCGRASPTANLKINSKCRGKLILIVSTLEKINPIYTFPSSINPRIQPFC